MLAFLARVFLLGSSFAAASLVGAAAALAGGGASANAAAAAAARLGAAPLGIAVAVAGAPHAAAARRPAVFVCNHQNILDLLLLGFVFPANCAILAKSSFKYIPFMGQFLWLADNIFIDRENAKSAAKTMAFVAREMKRKNVGIFMFPEGTRSYQRDNSMLPFKKGAFRLAIEGQVPIVPIVISTYYDVCDPKRGIFKGGNVRVQVLPPISTIGKTDADLDDLLHSTRELMINTLREISLPPPTTIKIKSKL
ncbi:hypothetical protein BDR26DRAFT_911629 [Obelidium mucronatum]|nr:hypothetical protein BDR26DRAFT_911629 [Obelidium mucronatum]